ncbi:hypothetical protein HDU98_007779 [Podochytrium sp. JEL0797]|nr:hypothetical protein HDU98_007779 [Podochytrium sp. JEL0797]
MSNNSTDATSYNFLFIGCHVASAISVLGILLNLSLLAVTISNFDKLVGRSQSHIGSAVLVLCGSSIISGLLIVALNELWVESAEQGSQTGTVAVIYIPNVGDSMASVTYLVLTLVFSANLLLAVDRFSLIRSVLSRCMFMGIGLVLFYCPNIIIMFVCIFNSNAEIQVQNNQNLQFATTVIPAMDPFWAALIVLLFQSEFRDVYVQGWKGVKLWVFKFCRSMVL